MTKELRKLQQLIIDIDRVERSHYIPQTERHENVIEHSFTLAVLCWRIFEILKPPLDVIRIFKYALIHDFTERGQRQDINTYAKENERKIKKDLEAGELLKLTAEFEDFGDFTKALKNYEEKSDEEALFVWSVDKMQAPILSQMDNWRPHKKYGIPYEQFSNKAEELLAKCSPYLKKMFAEVFEEGKRTYYDRPKK